MQLQRNLELRNKHSELDNVFLRDTQGKYIPVLVMGSEEDGPLWPSQTNP